MTITRAKTSARMLDGFISAAPDHSSTVSSPSGLKTKRGICRSQVSVVLPDELIAQVDAAASQRYMSRSALVTLALRRLLSESE